MEPLSLESLKYLESKTLGDVDTAYCLYGASHLAAARRYITECPLEELPKYINNPSYPIKEIIRRRLRGGPDKLQ